MATIKTQTRQFEQVPEPYEEIGSVLAATKALKKVVEQLTAGPSAPKRIFIQRTAPNAYGQFDVWLKPPALAGEQFIWSYWDGEKWQIILDTTQPVGADSFETWLSGSNVALDNTAAFIDIVATPAFGEAGQKWKVDALIVAQDTATASAIIEGAIHDGTNYIAGHAVQTDGALQVVEITMSKIIDLTGPTTLTMRARDQSSINGLVLFSYSSVIADRSTGMVLTRLS